MTTPEETTTPTPARELAPEPDDLTIRNATMEDGAEVWRLVKDSKILDQNSSYTYLMFLDRFGETSVVVERETADGDEDPAIVGFVTAFRPPDQPDVIFVWQVAVDGSMRGRGLASRMLQALVRLEGCEGVRYLETTVTPSNGPSRALFSSFARSVDAEHEVSPYIREGMFPKEGHEDEELHRIGPFTVPATTSARPEPN